MIQLGELAREVIQEDLGFQWLARGHHQQLIAACIQAPNFMDVLVEPLLQRRKFPSRNVLLETGKGFFGSLYNTCTRCSLLQDDLH